MSACRVQAAPSTASLKPSATTRDIIEALRSRYVEIDAEVQALEQRLDNTLLDDVTQENDTLIFELRKQLDRKFWLMSLINESLARHQSVITAGRQAADAWDPFPVSPVAVVIRDLPSPSTRSGEENLSRSEALTTQSEVLRAHQPQPEVTCSPPPRQPDGPSAPSTEQFNEPRFVYSKTRQLKLAAQKQRIPHVNATNIFKSNGFHCFAAYKSTMKDRCNGMNRQTPTFVRRGFPR